MTKPRPKYPRLGAIVCRVIGHRWVYGVATVPDCHIYDCPRCYASEIRGELR